MLTAEYLKVLSDTNTLRIMNLLLMKRLCVCELEALTDLKQSNLSRHLSKLSKSEMITRSKESQWVYYEIAQPFISSHSLLVDYLKTQFLADRIFIEDAKRLGLFEANSIDCNNITRNIDVLSKD